MPLHPAGVTEQKLVFADSRPVTIIAMKYSLRSLMKFSIRDLLFVTVIVAILAAWWVDRQRLIREIKTLTTDRVLML